MQFERCPACTALRIPDAQIHHGTVSPDSPGQLGAAMRMLFAMRLIWLRLCLPGFESATTRILDAGCGDGQFLEYLASRGYSKIVGYEIDPRRLAHARQRGSAVFPNMEAATRELKAFDFIFMWHVYEHIPEPLAVLRRLLACLSPSGTLIVSVPNHRSLQNLLFGFYSSLTDYHRHIWYLDEQYFSWLTHEIGDFEARRLPEFNFEYEIFSWVDSIASFALRSQNFIHRALKKKDGGISLRIAAALISVPLLPVAFVLSLATLIDKNRSSTLTYAVRRRS